MPHQFFFNDCFSDEVADDVIITGLVRTLREFRDLQSKKTDIERSIITHKFPSNCRLNSSLMLNTALDKIENRDDRVFGYALFTRYPIGGYFVDENVELARYRLKVGENNLDATNLAIAGEASAFLFTAATHVDLECDQLQLSITDDGGAPLAPIVVPNLFGTLENTEIICHVIDQRNFDALNLYGQLLQIVGRYHVSRQFQKEFNSLSREAQENVVSHFLDAKERRGLTPFFPDGNLIKDVTPPKCNHPVMELRIFRGRATRVYFAELNDVVFLASIGYKNAGDQSNDIRTAKSAIGKLIIFYR